MRPELQLILASASSLSLYPSPSGEGLKELQTIDALIPEVKDWEAFTQLLISNTTAPLLYSKLKQCNNAQLIPAASLALLRKAYYTTFSRSTLMYAEFGQVVQLFQENNIRFIALKGIYLCDWLYGDLGLRQMSDIDLLVDVHDAERCMELLRARGYEQHPNKGLSEFVDKVERAQLTDIIHYDSFHLRDITIEIHIKLTSDKEPFTIDIPSLFRATVPVVVNGLHIHALHPYDLLIHLTTHTDKHFKVGQIQLTCFSDLVNLLFLIDNKRQTTDNGLPPTPKGEQEKHRTTDDGRQTTEEEVYSKQFIVNSKDCPQPPYDLTLNPSPSGEGLKEGEGFSWEGLIARSKEFNCEEVVFTYLVLMHRFYKAPLPTAIVEKYEYTQSVAIDEQFIRYLNGEKFEIVSKTVVGGHLKNIKSIRSLPVFLRYIKEVLFPGKAFMIEKYLAPQPPKGGVKIGAQRINTSSYHHINTSKFWWLWYGYRWFTGLKGFWYVVTGNTEKKKEK